jgi:hypothetical protein
MLVEIKPTKVATMPAMASGPDAAAKTGMELTMYEVDRAPKMDNPVVE